MKKRTRMCVVSPAYNLTPANLPVVVRKTRLQLPVARLAAIAVLILLTATLFLTGIVGVGFNVFLNDEYAGVTPASHNDGTPAMFLYSPPKSKVKLFPRFVLNRGYTPDYIIAERLMLIDGQLFEGSALICDNRLMFIMESRDEVQSIVNEYIKPYKTENTTVAVLDCNSRIVNGIYKTEDKSEAGEALAALYGVNVITLDSVSTNEPVAYTTEAAEDNTMALGTVTVTEEGSNGEMEVTRVIKKINGIVAEEKIVGQTMISVPVSRIEVHGTRVVSGEGTGSFLCPVSGAVSSPFGSRWGRQHNGTDFFGNTGDPVEASDGGTVSFIGPVEGYGNLVIIDHKNGYETYYGHLNSIYVSVGDKLLSGEIIGEIGSTGNSTGPHLHFEIRKDGIPLNPEDIVNIP